MILCPTFPLILSLLVGIISRAPQEAIYLVGTLFLLPFMMLCQIQTKDLAVPLRQVIFKCVHEWFMCIGWAYGPYTFNTKWGWYFSWKICCGPSTVVSTTAGNLFLEI